MSTQVASPEVMPFVTVNGLIERLKQLPPNALVMALPYGGDAHNEFSSVEIRPEKEETYVKPNCFIYQDVHGWLTYGHLKDKEEYLSDPSRSPILREDVDVVLLMRHIPAQYPPFYATYVPSSLPNFIRFREGIKNRPT